MHRLRDLSARQRLLAAAIALLLVVPFGASFGHAADRHWLPTGDDALIGLRSYDVFTEHRPLVGQPSTSHLYGPEEGTAHPGPIEFYWMATPLRVLGPSTGMLLGSLVVNLSAVLVAAWVVFRRAGPVVGAWSGVLLGTVLLSEGSAVLTDPISSNAGGIPLLALAALSWAVVDGDRRLLPLAALYGSWVVQQHLAIVAPSAALVIWAVLGTAVGLGAVLADRRRSASAGAGADRAEPPVATPSAAAPAEDDIWIDEAQPLPPAVAGTAPAAVDADPSDDRTDDARNWPWVAGAVAVGLVCWSPVIYQQLTGHPGNITAVLEYARTSETAKLGWGDGFRQAVRAVGFPPLLLRRDLRGQDFFPGPLGVLEVAFAVTTYLTLLACVVLGWRRRRPLALLAATTLALTAAGTYNGKTIPDSIEALRINFYRWTFVVAWLSWIVLGWVAVLGVQALLRRWERPAPAVLRPVGAALAVLALVVSGIGSITTDGFDDRRRDQAGFQAMETVADAAVAEAEGHHTVTLVLRGRSAATSIGPALTLQLTAAGHHVVLPRVEGRFYGDQRVLEPEDDPGTLILELLTGRGGVPDGPGRTISRAELNPELTEVLGPLIATFRGTTPVVSPDGPRLLAAAYPDPTAQALVETSLTRIGLDPAGALRDPIIVGLVADGYFRSPVVDPALARRVAELLPGATVWDDDVLEVRVLTREELRAEMPEWQGPPE